MAGDRQEKRTSAGEKVAAGLLDGHEKALDMVGDHLLRDAPRTTRFVLKRIPGGTVVYGGCETFNWFMLQPRPI
jgi:hypothetical protein